MPFSVPTGVLLIVKYRPRSRLVFGRVQSIVRSVSVCLFVCLLTYLKNYIHFYKIFYTCSGVPCCSDMLLL